MTIESNPYAPPAARVADTMPQAGRAESLPFFAVSATKLTVMFVGTFGIYGVYWFYRHWKAVRARTGEGLYPVARAVFSVFFCYSLFRRIRDFRSDLPSSSLAAGPLAVAWFVLSLLWNLPGPLMLVGYAGLFPLLRVQAAANTINAETAPGHDPNSRFSAGNWVAILLGIAFQALALLGMSAAPGR